MSPLFSQSCKHKNKSGVYENKTKRIIAESENEPIKRRETSKRAAKEKINIQQILSSKPGEDDGDEPLEFQDSDSDPAWTPLSKEEMEEEASSTKKTKKSRSSMCCIWARVAETVSNLFAYCQALRVRLGGRAIWWPPPEVLVLKKRTITPVSPTPRHCYEINRVMFNFIVA